MKKGMALFLAVFCLLAVSCTAQNAESSAPADSAVSSGTEASIPEESSIQREYPIGSDKEGIEKAKEVADDYYKNEVGSERLGWKIKEYKYDPVYGSDMERIWLRTIETKAAAYPDWTYYPFRVELEDNLNHMILVGKSPENEWKVVNFGN